jgi:hypothetical protein
MVAKQAQDTAQRSAPSPRVPRVPLYLIDQTLAEVGPDNPDALPQCPFGMHVAANVFVLPAADRYTRLQHVTHVGAHAGAVAPVFEHDLVVAADREAARNPEIQFVVRGSAS